MPITVFSEQVGELIQWVNTQTGAVATGTTIMPADNTIPQNTEGDEYMTLAITPTSAINILLIDVVINLGFVPTAGNEILQIALFQDATASAIASALGYSLDNGLDCVKFRHKMTAGTTSATTFKVRAGNSIAGTITFNGESGGALHGGVLASSITIMEVRP